MKKNACQLGSGKRRRLTHALKNIDVPVRNTGGREEKGA